MARGKKKGAPEKTGRSTPATLKPGSSLSTSRWHWLVALTLTAFAGVAAFALFDFLFLTRVPHAVVGTWVVMDVKTTADAKADESLKGGRLEFRPDGTMIGTVNMDGKEGKIKATVVVDGQTLRITSVNPSTGQSVTDVQTIRTLEGDRFVIEDRKGTVLMMERLPE